MIFIIKSFQSVVFIFIVIFTTFRPIRPPAFFMCLSNSGTYKELWTTSLIESTGVTCSDSVSHNRVQMLSIPLLLPTCSKDWTSNHQMIISLEALVTNAYNRYAMCPAGIADCLQFIRFQRGHPFNYWDSLLLKFCDSSCETCVLSANWL